MAQITIHKAKSSLSKLIALVQAGGEVIVCRGQEPVAMLVPYRKGQGKRPRVGEITSKRIQCKPGCFAPLTDDDLKAWGMG